MVIKKMFFFSEIAKMTSCDKIPFLFFIGLFFQQFFFLSALVFLAIWNEKI